ncbi:MAG: polysaccharide biosynthesis protein [Lachnospiraceae bacterium]|nr:polysaccharide biosynthesis protein [Lachnospiraceae bacterium]
MRVLILSCNTGEGHNSCSKAIQNYFRNHNIVCETVDALRFLSPRFSNIISRGHTKLYLHAPKLFHSAYQYAQIHNRIFTESSCIYKLLSSATDKLYHFIQEHDYDIILCTHVFSGLMITDVRRKHHTSFRTAFISTDYTCSPSCGESILDVYFIPDATLLDEFAACGIPKTKLIVSGIPVREKFLHPIDKYNAKKRLLIPASSRHLLIMCGSMGCGPIRSLVKLINDQLPDNCYVSVICGTNKRLQQQLMTDYYQQPFINVYGYRNDISAIMDSADLYLTKPGGLSTTEAAAKKLPMVFINNIAGCETHNMHYFLQQGCAVSANTPEEVVSVTLSLLSNTKQLQQMSDSFSYPRNPSPAELIFDYFTK